MGEWVNGSNPVHPFSFSARTGYCIHIDSTSSYNGSMAHRQAKDETLNIRASAAQKAKLSEAARLQNMNVSQFVLHKSLDAAEAVIADQLVVRVSGDDFDWF